MSRRLGISALAVSLLVILLAAWGLRASIFDSPSYDSWIETQPRHFVRRIQASGELRSANSISVGPPQIRRVWRFTVNHMAPEGKPVKEGQRLVSFDTQKLTERLEVKTSKLETARKEFEKTQLETTEALEAMLLAQVELEAKRLQFARKLDVPEEMRSRLELEKIQLESALTDREIAFNTQKIDVQQRNRDARVTAASQRVEKLEKQIGRLEADIARMTVHAARSGFVVHTVNWRGEKVRVGETIYYGQTLIKIADLDQMELSAEIAEPDAGHIAIGQRAEIHLDAAPDRTFTGNIRELGRLFRNKSWESPTRVFDAVISIDNPDPELMRPGMAASVEILSPSAAETIQVPEMAILDTADGPMIELHRGLGAGSLMPVTLGERYDGMVVIEKGLKAGDRYRAVPGESSP